MPSERRPQAIERRFQDTQASVQGRTQEAARDDTERIDREGDGSVCDLDFRDSFTVFTLSDTARLSMLYVCSSVSSNHSPMRTRRQAAGGSCAMPGEHQTQCCPQNPHDLIPRLGERGKAVGALPGKGSSQCLCQPSGLSGVGSGLGPSGTCVQVGPAPLLSPSPRTYDVHVQSTAHPQPTKARPEAGT